MTVTCSLVLVKDFLQCYKLPQHSATEPAMFRGFHQLILAEVVLAALKVVVVGCFVIIKIQFIVIYHTATDDTGFVAYKVVI